MSEIQTSVSVTETTGSRFAQTVAVGRHVLSADEPTRSGGADLGPSPYEFLLAGLGACTSMTLRMYAERRGWALTRTTVELHHWKAATAGEAPKDYFHRVLHLEGALTETQKLTLLQIAEKCPVSRTLSRAAALCTALAERGDSAAANTHPALMARRGGTVQ